MKPFDPVRYGKRLAKPNTWAAIKTMIEAAGVTDDTPVHSLDIGPYACGVTVSRTAEGVEIDDDSAPIVEALPVAQAKRAAGATATGTTAGP